MSAHHKAVRRFFQVLVLTAGLMMPVQGQAKDLTPQQALTMIQTAAKKKEFSKEFSAIIEAPPAIDQVLIEVLHSSANRWEERWFSALTLGKRGSEAAQKALLKSSEDPLFIIRQASIMGLSYFEDAESLKAIRKALDDTAMVVRSEAIDAILKRKDPSVIHRLEKELYARRNFQKGRSLWIRPQIVHALGQLGDPKGVDVLLKSMHDKDKDVATLSCQSLHTIAVENQWALPSKDHKNCSKNWQAWSKKEPKAKKIQ